MRESHPRLVLGKDTRYYYANPALSYRERNPLTNILYHKGRAFARAYLGSTSVVVVTVGGVAAGGVTAFRRDCVPAHALVP